MNSTRILAAGGAVIAALTIGTVALVRDAADTGPAPTVRTPAAAAAAELADPTAPEATTPTEAPPVDTTPAETTTPAQDTPAPVESPVADPAPTPEPPATTAAPRYVTCFPITRPGLPGQPVDTTPVSWVCHYDDTPGTTWESGTDQTGPA